MAGLREVMKRGAYDVLHCHHDIMSAAYLLASIGLPFKKRIVHLHNTSMSLPTPSRVKSELAREPMRQICLRMADQIVGISKEALESLIGDGTYPPSRRVVHYAIDTNRVQQASVDPVEFRRRMGCEPAARVLLFVGRMVGYKNPCFVLEMLDHMAKTGENAVAVFAGTGNLESELRELAKLKSLEHRVRLLGFRNDVTELMLASNILIWPSREEPMEGLGLGIVEAQSAGLPVLMSLSVPEEAIVVPELVTVLPLAAEPEAWAETTIEILNRQHPSRAESLARVEASSFSISAGVSNLIALYDGLEN
jgi:glycosyltransferase involved in cell wall biosynthesis